jgi:hypothetical protein
VTPVNSLSLPGFHLFAHGLEVSLHSVNADEMQSMSEKDFECFASTGVKTPRTMSPNWPCRVTFEAACGPGRHHPRSAPYVRVEYASLNFAVSLHLDEQAIVARLRKGIGE